MSSVSLGSRIKGARLAAGYGEGQAATFARDAGVSKQYLNNLEKDRARKPDPSELVKIARRANIDLEWLITGDDLLPRRVRLSHSEKHLLSIFRELSEAHQQAVISMAESLSSK